MTGVIMMTLVIVISQFLSLGQVSEHAKDRDPFRTLPGRHQTRRRPCPSRSLAAFELSFSPPSSPPSLSRFPAACNRLIIKGKFNKRTPATAGSLRGINEQTTIADLLCTTIHINKLRRNNDSRIN